MLPSASTWNWSYSRRNRAPQLTREPVVLVLGHVVLIRQIVRPHRFDAVGLACDYGSMTLSKKMLNVCRSSKSVKSRMTLPSGSTMTPPPGCRLRRCRRQGGRTSIGDVVIFVILAAVVADVQHRAAPACRLRRRREVQVVAEAEQVAGRRFEQHRHAAEAERPKPGSP